MRKQIANCYSNAKRKLWFGYIVEYPFALIMLNLYIFLAAKHVKNAKNLRS